MPLRTYAWDCLCCGARDLILARSARTAARRLMAPCACPSERCMRCHQCASHCPHACPICGRRGLSAWWRVEDRPFFAICEEHLARWVGGPAARLVDDDA